MRRARRFNTRQDKEGKGFGGEAEVVRGRGWMSGVSSGEEMKKKMLQITKGSKTNSPLVQKEGSKSGKAQRERQGNG